MIERTAVISDDGLYRSLLGRRWSAWPLLGFCMLNPSIADAAIDDPTIRRCVGFARDLGYGGISVVNLYAFRATSPQALLAFKGDIIGPENDATIRAWAIECPTLVAAWGSYARSDRVDAVRKLIEPFRFMALGVTKTGQPRHPLYLPKTAERVPWP